MSFSFYKNPISNSLKYKTINCKNHLKVIKMKSLSFKRTIKTILATTLLSATCIQQAKAGPILYITCNSICHAACPGGSLNPICWEACLSACSPSLAIGF